LSKVVEETLNIMPEPAPVALYKLLSKQEAHVDKVLRKNDVSDVRDSPKPWLAIPKTFPNLIGKHWQDHTWGLGQIGLLKNEPRQVKAMDMRILKKPTMMMQA